MSRSDTWPRNPAVTSRSPCGENSDKKQDEVFPPTRSVFSFVARSHNSMLSERQTDNVLLSGEKLIRAADAAGSVNDSQFAVFQIRILWRCNEAASQCPSGEYTSDNRPRF